MSTLSLSLSLSEEQAQTLINYFTSAGMLHDVADSARRFALFGPCIPESSALLRSCIDESSLSEPHVRMAAKVVLFAQPKG